MFLEQSKEVRLFCLVGTFADVSSAVVVDNECRIDLCLRISRACTPDETDRWTQGRFMAQFIVGGQCAFVDT